MALAGFPRAGPHAGMPAWVARGRPAGAQPWRAPAAVRRRPLRGAPPDIRAALPDSDELAALVVAADVMEADLPSILPTDRLDLVMQLFGQTHRDELPVVTSREAREVLGVVTREDVIRAYHQRIFRLDKSGGFQSITEAVRQKCRIEVLGGVYLMELDVPHSLVGQTLQEASLRQRLGIEVVLIHSARAANDENQGKQFPSPDARLEAGDRILVMGSEQAIEKLQE